MSSFPNSSWYGIILKELLERQKDIYFSVSATTRQPRPGEIDGVHYYFRTVDDFQKLIEKEALLEWAEYVGNFYGTPAKYVDEAMDAGRNVILDIEVQGARQVMESSPEAILVFLAPPSLAELEHRLRLRGTESDEVIRGRMARAKEECMADFYQYIVFNENADEAARELDAIITAANCRYSEQKKILKEVYES